MKNQKIFCYSISYFILVLFFLSFSVNTFAGAWPQKKGGYYFKLSGNYFFTRSEFNHLGNKVAIFAEKIAFKNASFRDFNINIYAEYGFTSKLTGIVNVPFKILNSKWDKYLTQDILASRESLFTNGLGDFSLISRYAIITNPIVLSLQGGVKLPLGYDKRPSNDGAPLGTGDLDYEGHLLFGFSFHPIPIYFTSGIGYRVRTGRLHDEILYSVEIGYNKNRLLFKINLDGIQNTTTPLDLIGLPVVTPLPGGGGVNPSVIVGDQNILKISPAIIYNIKDHLAIQAEVLHIFSGKNTTSGSIFSLGFIFSK